MSLISKVKDWIKMLLGNKIKNDFDVKPILMPRTNDMLRRCAMIYSGVPEWLDEADGIRTINFAQSLCTETARLTTLAIGIRIDGSARAEWLQEQIDSNYYRLREWVEYGAANGTVIFKPNGKGVDCMLPSQFAVISTDDSKITGIVFIDDAASADGKTFYHRLEYHRFEDDGKYTITNKCYESDTPDTLGDPCDIKGTPWVNLEEETTIENIGAPLFGVFRTPSANFLEQGNPLGLPLFANAINELKDLDIAYSRNAMEIKDSETIVLLDSDRLVPDGGSVGTTTAQFEREREEMKLPHYIRNVYGDGRENFYQEITPALRTTERMVGINAMLGQIGFKCGFSNGYFVFNEKSGMVTATQVESDDRRTIQLIKDYRDKLEDAIDGLIAALNTFADLYDLAPVGKYEVTYDFGDITYNREEDRQRWMSYVISGLVPAWKYFEKFEGIPEEEAKALVESARPQETILAEEEE